MIRRYCEIDERDEEARWRAEKKPRARPCSRDFLAGLCTFASCKLQVPTPRRAKSARDSPEDAILSPPSFRNAKVRSRKATSPPADRYELVNCRDVSVNYLLTGRRVIRTFSNNSFTRWKTDREREQTDRGRPDRRSENKTPRVAKMGETVTHTIRLSASARDHEPCPHSVCVVIYEGEIFTRLAIIIGTRWEKCAYDVEQLAALIWSHANRIASTEHDLLSSKRTVGRRHTASGSVPWSREGWHLLQCLAAILRDAIALATHSPVI